MEDSLSSTTKFVEVPRLDVTQATEVEIIDKVHELCVKQGIPLVLENYHLKKEFDAELFTKEWIQRNCGDQEISARDVNNILDEQMKLSDYLDYVEKVSKDTGSVQQKLYAKDVTCPIVWKDYIGSFLPSYFRYNGNNDLMSNLTPDLRAENLMIYIGVGGTNTPLHKDMCSSFGHNIMVHADPDSWSTWYMIARDDKEKMSALVQALGQDVDLENYYVPLDILEKADFTVYHTKQLVGDFVMVPSECCHEVINVGSCTIKVSWNRITPYSAYLGVMDAVPSYQRVLRPETYQMKRLVFESLNKWTEAISTNLRCSSADHLSPSLDFVTRIENAPGRDLRTEYKLLIITYKYIIEQEWVSNEHWNDGVHFPLTPDNKSHMSCDFCHCDLWNRHVHCYDCKTEAGVNYDLCLNCYANGRACSHLMQIRKGRKMKRLRNVYTYAKDAFEKKFGKDDELVDPNDLINDSEATLAYIRWKKADSDEDMGSHDLKSKLPEKVYMQPYWPQAPQVRRNDDESAKDKLEKSRKKRSRKSKPTQVNNSDNQSAMVDVNAKSLQESDLSNYESDSLPTKVHTEKKKLRQESLKSTNRSKNNGERNSSTRKRKSHKVTDKSLEDCETESSPVKKKQNRRVNQSSKADSSSTKSVAKKIDFQEHEQSLKGDESKIVSINGGKRSRNSKKHQPVLNKRNRMTNEGESNNNHDSVNGVTNNDQPKLDDSNVLTPIERDFARSCRDLYFVDSVLSAYMKLEDLQTQQHPSPAESSL
ncbi:24665_t:CDS:10 [Cetraspora pellucida]|uniref:24665_t:CDS:1 n=1 Tax=Cetraspora pellucida TaxID=1433469 RepID=A0A9N9ICZ0_9GLOM|nr:24665_t:CDS:10 [Cetraspora pellucida]